jgi:hypothetical protein
MHFLVAAERRNVRRMRLEQFVLLAIRTAIVLFLVLAFASVAPWAEALWLRVFPNASIRTIAGRLRTHKIIVLDGSLSMAATDGRTTCFDRARTLAQQLVRESAGADGFSVMLMAAPPRRIVSGPSEEPAKAVEELAGLVLSHGNADLLATLGAIESLLQVSPEKYDNREIYFFTDLQRATWAPPKTQEVAESLRKLQARAQLIVLDVGQDLPFNSAVTSLQVSEPFVTPAAPTPISATIQHYGAETRRQVRAELLAGKARAAQTDPPFRLRVMQQSVVDLVPGQNTVNFVYKFPSPGEYAVQIRLENDRLDLDDSRTIIVKVREDLPILIVNGKPAAELYDRAGAWLADALNPFQQGPIPQNIAARPRMITESEFADASFSNLNRYACVFLCDVARPSEGGIARLDAHLRRGGGVVFTLGPQVDPEAYNRVLNRGDAILPARLIARQRASSGHFFNLFAEEQSFREPPLAAFVSEQDRAALLSAHFREYIRVEPIPGREARTVLQFVPEFTTPKPINVKETNANKVDAQAVNSRPSASSHTTSRDPALIAWPRYRGRVLLFTSTVNMDWTTWPVSPSFPAMMQELLQYAAAGRTSAQTATVGEAVECFPETCAPGLEAAVRTPDGHIEETRTESLDHIGVLRWTDTSASGIYVMTLGQHPQEHLFALNVPSAADDQQASESDPTRVSGAELRAAYPDWYFELANEPRAVHHPAGSTKGSSDGRSGMGSALARWSLLTMLALLVVEVIVAWRFGHYSAVTAVDDAPRTASGILPATIAISAGLLFVIMAGVLIHASWSGDFLGFLPEQLRRSAEARLGVPSPAAGEGTRWVVELTPFLRDPASDRWLAGGAALGMAILVVWIYSLEGKTANRWYKLLLAGLRLFVLLVALVILLPQLRLWFERQGWPDIAILIDDSGSMGVTDRYEDSRIQAGVERLIQGQQGSSSQRLKLVQSILTSNQGTALGDLLSQLRVRLHLYHCSTQAGHLNDISESRHVDGAIQAVRDLRPEGTSSRLGTAVRQVLNDYRGSSLAALIMLTDGVTTDGDDLVKASHYAARAGVPLFFVGIGEAHEAPNFRIHDLQVEDTVYANDRLVFEANLTAHGFEKGKTAAVVLSEKSSDGRLKPLAQEKVSIDPEGRPVRFRLMHQPARPGQKTYILHMPAAEEASQRVDSNRLEKTVLVREAKLIKVLYVEGYARYEYRFIKNLLERENDVDSRNKSIDLKVLLLEADPEYASEDKSALSDFPTPEELNQYDTVILGDVDPEDRRLGDRNLRYLVDFVKERGGGLLMIAGPRFSPHAYKDSPLAAALPIQVLQPPEAIDRAVAYKPELTLAGRFHPIFRFSPDEEENTAIWNRLAPMYWWAEGYGIKPAAEVLLVHPRRTTADPNTRRISGGNEARHPLAVQHFFGAGRSMFFGFEETWRWRFRDDEIRFNQFWIQTIRYLAKRRSGRVELRLDRQAEYRCGEPIKVMVRFPDDMPAPSAETKVEVLVMRVPAKNQPAAEIEKMTLGLSKVEGSRATFEGQVTRTPDGEYRFSLTWPIVPNPKPEAEARVLPPPGEMEQLRMNQKDMELAAEATHGHFYTLADLDQLADDLPVGARSSRPAPQPPWLLWNHSLVLALTLGLLTAEWVLRKRKYLL